MSGIVAVFNREGVPIDQSALECMLAANSHQAVDGQHIWLKDSIVLAHQHFWITPEEQGEQQPIVLNDGKHAITFDGRLDNRRQLIDSLRLWDLDHIVTDGRIGVVYLSTMGSYICAHYFGDFAFIVWDDSERHLFIVSRSIGCTPSCILS